LKSTLVLCLLNAIFSFLPAFIHMVLRPQFFEGMRGTSKEVKLFQAHAKERKANERQRKAVAGNGSTSGVEDELKVLQAVGGAKVQPEGKNLPFCCAAVLLCCCATVLPCCYAAMLLCCYDTLLLHCYAAVLLFY
jgi:hypothetical protein